MPSNNSNGLQASTLKRIQQEMMMELANRHL